MADGFHVDLGALERAAAGVNGTLDEVSHQPVSDIPVDEPAVGHEVLAAALVGFCGRWQLGVDNLVKDGREIAARLTVNAALYHQAEQNILGTIRNGALFGPGPDPGVQ